MGMALDAEARTAALRAVLTSATFIRSITSYISDRSQHLCGGIAYACGGVLYEALSGLA